MLTKEKILAHLKSVKANLAADGIVRLGLFGSFAKGTADMASDVDIVVESSEAFREKHRGFDGLIYLDSLRLSFERKFARSVDLCNTAFMSEERRAELLEGVVYV